MNIKLKASDMTVEEVRELSAKIRAEFTGCSNGGQMIIFGNDFELIPIHNTEVEDMNCRNCGAPLELSKSRYYLKCDHCGTEKRIKFAESYPS